MFSLLYRLFCGYLYVRVRAEHPEKILNLCGAKGMRIWRVSRKGKDLYFKICLSSFKQLRKDKRRIPAKIHITKKVGWPFFVARNRHRYGMPVGLVVCFLLLQFLSGHVWNICIQGNDTVKKEEILTALHRIGVREGMPISRLVPEEKRNELLLQSPALSWAAINVEGSKVTVEVTEAKLPPQTDRSPSNIVAEEMGIIRRMEVRSGVSMVQVGEAVYEGQMLVSGVNEYEDQTTGLVRSVGSIYAEVEITLIVTQPKTVCEPLPIGKTKTKKVLSFFGLNLPLYCGYLRPPYESKATLHQYVTKDSYLPISVTERTFSFLQEKTYDLTKKQAHHRVLSEMEQQIQKEIGDGEVITRKDTFYRQGDQYVLQSKITCLKDIAREEKMRLNTGN